MAFKNLQERFTAKAREVYAHGSTRDGSDAQPFLEFKPNDPNRNETRYDSRLLPVGSTKRDLQRVGDFLKSRVGFGFLLQQQIQQSANTFSETRVLNPAFIVASLIPGIHVARTLAAQNTFAVVGTNRNKLSPVSFDPKIQSAGRLQKASSSDATSRAIGASAGTTGLLARLNPVTIAKGLASTFSLDDNGTLGGNERPELNVDGEYFAVRLWEGGYQKTPQDGLSSVAANLRAGDFVAAAKSVKGSVSNFLFGTQKRIPDSPSKADGRESASTKFDGRRYFFQVGGSDERYLQYSMESDGDDRPVVTMPFLTRKPYNIKITPPIKATKVAKVNTKAHDLTKAQLPESSVAIPQGQQPAVLPAPAANEGSANPAEDSMHFAGLSLRQRYLNEERMAFIRQTLQTQKDTSFAYWKPQSSFKLQGWQETNVKVAAGQENDIDARIYRGPTYLRDMTNSDVELATGKTGLTDEGLRAYQDKVGANTVLVVFYDYGNNQAIPFRAMISGLQEFVRPEYQDTRYVGRVERNIVYFGATREVSFNLKVHAFSEDELLNVWEKVRHLTGLCFPSEYANGYMVPPFVKLTIGGIYRDQPGYITSITNVVEDDTSWDVAKGQVPHGLSLTIGYSIIEKTHPTTFTPFYAITKGN
jgi:hypothetical protein